MELQQRTELNIGTPRAARSTQKPDAGASQRAGDDRRDSGFNEQVKKQLERDKTQQARENSSNNQKDRKTSADAEQAAGNTSERPAESADTTRVETEAAEDSTTVVEPADTERAISEFAAQLQSGLLDGETDTEAGAETGALASSDLPQGGNALPSQVEALNAASLNMGKAEAEAVSTATDGDKLNARTLQQKAAAADQAILQSLNQQASHVNRDGAAEAPALDAKGLKLNLSEDMMTARNAQFKTLSELPTAEMIGKASRLQQVPLSTALASSMPASANVNASPLSALDSAGFNLNAPLTNGLGAAGLSTSIMTPLQSPGWSQQMTDQVNLMLKGGFQQADIKLNPAHLGPMEIKLSMNDDKASIHFVAQHAPVRDAIDSALPRLREMLEQQGLSLADVDVSAHSEQQQSDSGAQQSASTMLPQGEAAESSVQGRDELPVTQISLSVESGINLYA